MLVFNESKTCKIAQNFQIPSKPIEIFKYGLVRVVVNGDGFAVRFAPARYHTL